MNRMLVAAIAMALALAFQGCVCAPGKVACDNSCVDVSSDAQHCGACGRTCNVGQICVDSACVGSGGAACTRDADCDDGQYCTGIEHCVAGICRKGQVVVCDDGVSCTEESCSEAIDACVARPVHSRCAAGTSCTAPEASGSGCR